MKNGLSIPVIVALLFATLSFSAMAQDADTTATPETEATAAPDANATEETTEAPAAEAATDDTASEAKTEDAATESASAEDEVAKPAEEAAPSKEPTAGATAAPVSTKGKVEAKTEPKTQASEAAPKAKKRDSKGVGLGLAPGVPEISTLPGGVAPKFDDGAGATSAWQFNFHGMIYVPLRFGIGERENPGADQKKMVFHAPPRVPGAYETFSYTSTVPNPWTQLNFSYGNDTVIANVTIAARTVTSANGYFNPPDMLGINDAYITFLGVPTDNLKLQLNMGAFANRYGNMGEFDLGRFNTPLIARVAGTGLTGTALYALNAKTTLIAELGYQGQFAKAPVGVEPAGWNGFADPTVGSSYAMHGHAGVNLNKKVELGGHFIRAFTRDDRSSVESTPDGSITVGAADLRFTLARFGHLYTGISYTKSESAAAVSNVVRVLNAPGGKGLMQEYLGPDSDGNGALTSWGLQYDLSLGNLLRHPSAFEGNAPDLMISLFEIFTHVKSDDADFNQINKLKWGGELNWVTSKWFTLGARYDLVLQELGEDARTHEIISGRLIFHSDWNSRDQLTLQYSHYRTGNEVAVREGYPPADDLTIVPDDHVISLTASMWW